MPVIQKIAHQDGQRSAVWDVKEDEFALLEMAALNQADADAYALITNPGRRLEWLAVRVLLKEFYPSPPSIIYKDNGKPFFANCPDKISISHSGKMVAIALNSEETPGIDIERLHPRILKIANRFTGEKEKEYLGANPSIEQLTIVWGAKEVMFKVYSLGEVSFKTELMLQPFKLSTEGILNGFIYKGKRPITVPMNYKQINDFILIQTDYSHKDFEKNF